MGDSRATSEPRATGASDDMVMDGIDRGRPPDRMGSWAERVMGTKAGGRMVPEEVIAEEFVKARLSVEFPEGEDGEPEITVGEEVLEAMNGLWRNCMIVKVLGRSVPIAVLNRKLRELWKPRGTMNVVDLPRQFFLVRFGEEEEYLSALTGGPWKAFGGYLMVQAWAPEFDPMRDAIVTTPVWVRLSNLPVNLYHKSILMGIATSLGKPVRVDDMTLSLERARFARVCVEVDLRKPLKGSVKINKERYYVAYEGMSNICSNCGIYGHVIHQCPKLEVTQQRAVVMEKSTVETRKERTEEEGFTTVRRSSRKSKEQASPVVLGAGGMTGELGRNLQVITRKSGEENILSSNRFGNLGLAMIESEKGEGMLITDEDKENRVGTISDVNGKWFNAKPMGKIGGIGRQGNIGGKGNSKAKRAGVTSTTPNGPRNKYQQHRPTRGLIFGPSQRDAERSSSGKRLRVEGVNAGRQGGSVEQCMEGNAGIPSLSEGSEETGVQEELLGVSLEKEKGKGVQIEQTTSSIAMELSVE